MSDEYAAIEVTLKLLGLLQVLWLAIIGYLANRLSSFGEKLSEMAERIATLEGRVTKGT